MKGLNDLLKELSQNAQNIRVINLFFLMQHEDTFCEYVSMVCQQLLMYVDKEKIEKVQLSSYANENMIEAVSNYS